METKRSTPKISIAIISGTLEDRLHPVPPVADGAPEWNVFRLAEAAAKESDSQLDIHVISPCETNQWEIVQNYPVFDRGKYHYVVFPPSQFDTYRKVLRHLLPLRLLVRRAAKLPDLMSWWYLRQVTKFLRAQKPDFVVINDRPQYIAYLRNKVSKGRLFLMLRYPLGESRYFLSLLDGIVVNSQGMRVYVEEFIQPNAPPVWQIPNTLENDFFMPDLVSDRFTCPEKIVLFVGRLVEEKGVRELLLAFQDVYAVFPNAKLVICGTGNDSFAGTRSSYEQDLRQIAKQFPMGVVEFKGYIPNQCMQGYYRRATVAVFPSLPQIYIESFGMVALEAMRCGTPVVASRQPGFEELVLSGETGLLVDNPCNVASLTSAILQILQDSNLAQHMGDAGYQRSLNYSPDQALTVLWNIFANR